jgi:hypothetical protein
MGGRVQTQYTRIPKLLVTQRVHGGRKKFKKKNPQKKVPRKVAKMVPKEGAEIKHKLVSKYVGGTCRQFRRTCILGGKVAKLVIDPMSGMNIVSKEAVWKLGLETKRHPNSYQLEWLTTSAVFHWN